MHRAFIALLALASPLQAQQADPVHSDALTSFDHGILCFFSEADPDTPLTDAEADAVAEADGVYDIIRTHTTQEIPAIEGLTFGIVSTVAAGTTLEVNTAVTHTGPDGVIDAELFHLVIDDAPTIDGWNLDAADGALEGTYRFETTQGDRPIYDVTFRVVPLADYTGEVPACATAG